MIDEIVIFMIKNKKNFHRSLKVKQIKSTGNPLQIAELQRNFHMGLVIVTLKKRASITHRTNIFFSDTIT